LVEKVGVVIPDEIDADTTGGLVVELIGRIPQVGERARLGRYEIRVLDAEPTRVRRVELIEVEPEAAGEATPRSGGRGDAEDSAADRDDD
jgi:CBS domain containing-hemolysin-like protein